MGRLEELDELDRLLYENCPSIEVKLLESLPNEEDINYEFSEKFEKKMKKIIKEQRRGPFALKFYKIGKRIAIVFIAITISLLSLTVSVEAFREKVIEVIKEVYEEFTLYKYEGESDIITKPIESLAPKYIPKGFKETDREVFEDFIILRYNDGTYYINYEAFETGNSRLYVDTENAEVSEIYINSNKADYITKGTYQSLVWENDGYGYVLNVESISPEAEGLDKNEFIKIAKSIKD